MPDALRPSRAGAPPINVSFEFFPPKSEEMETALWASIERLAPLNPSFVSVTYGAGGSTRQRTHSTLARLMNETSLKPAAHLTCVGASRSEIDEVVTGYLDIGVRHIVALRGDPPGGIGTAFAAHPDALWVAAVVAALSARQRGHNGVAGGCCGPSTLSMLMRRP